MASGLLWVEHLVYDLICGQMAAVGWPFRPTFRDAASWQSSEHRSLEVAQSGLRGAETRRRRGSWFCFTLAKSLGLRGPALICVDPKRTARHRQASGSARHERLDRERRGGYMTGLRAADLQSFWQCLQNFRRKLKEFKRFGGEWCNGSTTDSDSVCLGSNPGSPARSGASANKVDPNGLQPQAMIRTLSDHAIRP